MECTVVDEIKKYNQDDKRKIDDENTLKLNKMDYHSKGHLYGNFPNYYRFNPPKERIKILNQSFWKSIVQKKNNLTVLDVGCHNGTLTHLIRQSILSAGAQKVEIFGIDIDPYLIEEAKNYFKDCFFEVNNFVLDDMPFNLQKFDLITCFGTTMWIHLNYGDHGLWKFLVKLRDSALLCVIIEPQQWRSYQNALIRLRKSKISIPESFRSIQITKNKNVKLFIDHIMQKKFPQKCILGKTNWQRSIIHFSL